MKIKNLLTLFYSVTAIALALSISGCGKQRDAEAHAMIQQLAAKIQKVEQEHESVAAYIRGVATDLNGLKQRIAHLEASKVKSPEPAPPKKVTTTKKPTASIKSKASPPKSTKKAPPKKKKR
ncbi:MAG: hypothetical protein AB7P04_10375 [Bacteriovoracia bacterium]